VFILFYPRNPQFHYKGEKKDEKDNRCYLDGIDHDARRVRSPGGTGNGNNPAAPDKPETPANPANPANPTDPDTSPPPADTVVTIPELGEGEPADISLAYAHYIREALKGKGAAEVAITEETANFTPVFSNGEWLVGGPDVLIKTNLYEKYKLNGAFVDSGVEIMSGVKVVRDGADDKAKIACNRDVKAMDILYALGYSGTSWPVEGVELRNEGGGSMIPGANIKIHGGKWNEENNNPVSFAAFGEYASLLNSLGAYPSQGGSVLPDNSWVVIDSPGADANVAGNGIYEFYPAYYSPSSDAVVSDAGNMAMLPQFWPVVKTSGVVLTGRGGRTRRRRGTWAAWRPPRPSAKPPPRPADIRLASPAPTSWATWPSPWRTI
jgi:hypothetical protein